MNTKGPRWQQSVANAIVVGMLLATSGWSGAQAASNSSADRHSHVPRVISRDANIYGASYGEWSARWVQWWMSIPSDRNPFTDLTGVNCAERQSGPVWFLAGGPGATPPNRLCQVAAGKALFFPLVNSFFGAGVFDCDPTVPGVSCNLATLRAAAAASMDAVTLHAEIDGKAIQRLNEQRVISPAFEITYPADASQGVAAGTYSPNVGDGYWLMLAPLRAGAHTLHFRADITGGPFAPGVIEATYHLMVGP